MISKREKRVCDDMNTISMHEFKIKKDIKVVRHL